MRSTPALEHRPIATFTDAPVYRADHAPAQLCTVSQLRAQRRKVLPDQRPAGCRGPGPCRRHRRPRHRPRRGSSRNAW